MLIQNFAALVIGSCVVSGTVVAQRGMISPETIRAQSDAYREHGLRAAAAVTGSYVQEFRQPEVIFRELEELTKYGEAIVAGKITKSLPFISADGRDLFSAYRVSVDTVFRGDYSNGQDLWFAVRGGRVEFEDKTWVELRPPAPARGGWSLPATDQRYVLFLTKSPSDFTEKNVPREIEGRLWSPVGIVWGLIELSPTGVLFHSPSTGIASKFNGMSDDLFIAKVRAAVKSSQ